MCLSRTVPARSLKVDGTDVLIEGCLFESCYASKKGGGMHQGVGQISILNSVFYDNVAGSDNVESGRKWFLWRVRTIAKKR